MESEFVAFEWDEDKRAENLKKHGVDFFDLPSLLGLPHLTVAAPSRGKDPWAKPEDRWLAVLRSGDDIISAVYTVRGKTCRIISARPASKDEREAYNTHFS